MGYRLTSKHQVTIPKHVRDVLRLRAGSEIDFEIVDGSIRILRVDEALPAYEHPAVARLRASGANFDMTTDEVMALTRGWGEEHDA